MADLWLSLGSNLGNREATLLDALRALEARGLHVRAVSSMYATAPQGTTDQPEFLNCVARMQTDLPAREALRRCQEVEALYGRERTLRWGPRTLDIDLVFYDNLVSTDANLELPHPRLWERAFVLAPLLELWPDLTTPGGEPASDVLRRLSLSQRVQRVDQSNTSGCIAARATVQVTGEEHTG
ncbi:MAG TPA: 2-amino-4-hydroxy-6-hydroxymethyldihydropteridine diphosphokinase [Chloroflexota bacterium]